MAYIQSPLPGTFYHKPSPEAAPFKTTGDMVAADDTIGLVEVMKTYSEVKADRTGSFVRYVAQDGAAITAGEILAELDD